MNESCLNFVSRSLAKDLTGCNVLEVGSYDYNGTVRPLFENTPVACYIGVDITEGPGVDRVCSVHDLSKNFGVGTFDLVISTELLEHVDDWRSAIQEIKAVTRTGGTLILTTRSKGFPYHGYPYDFWRFGIDDFRQIFADCDIELLEADPTEPGVFLKARKTDRPSTKLSSLALYSILRLSRQIGHTQVDLDKIAKGQNWEFPILNRRLYYRVYWRGWRRLMRLFGKTVKRAYIRA